MQKKLVEKKCLATFVLVTGLFALWGFANDITNPMVAAFQTVMEISAAKASMIQFAFYGGYFTMAIPAALFVRRYSYKHGILLGLGLYSLGAFLFIPAAAYQEFTFFCLSLYILTFGLAFLETTANPFILSLGDKATSTRRLNLAQAFNPMGSLLGMLVASQIVLPALWSDRRDAAGQLIFSGLDAAEKEGIRVHDLAVIRDPYVALGLVVLVFFLILLFKKMPGKAATNTQMPLRGTLKRLLQNKVYREGVVAQMFYIGAQIMMWTFIIQYADRSGQSRGAALQHSGHGAVPEWPVCGHIPDALHQWAGLADRLCTVCRRAHLWCRDHRRHGRSVLPDSREHFHVGDVSDHLRHCPRGRERDGYDAGRRFPGDGHRGRRIDAAVAGHDYRCRRSGWLAGRQCVVPAAAPLLRDGACFRLPGLSSAPRLNAGRVGPADTGRKAAFGHLGATSYKKTLSGTQPRSEK